METQKIIQPMVTRTEYVMSNLREAKNPLEFKTAEKMALKRLCELEKIVKGISNKWFKNKTDLVMIEQTNGEMGRIRQLLEERREKFQVN